MTVGETLTREGCLERQRRFWMQMPEGIDWVVIGNPKHITYYVNFQINPISFSQDERALLILKRTGSSTLVADNFTWRSKTVDPYIDDEAIIPWYDHQHSVRDRAELLYSEGGQQLSELSGRGAIELRWVAAENFDDGVRDQIDRSTDPTVITNRLRRCKLDDEVTLIERCTRAAEAGHARALEFIRPGISDFDVYREVQSVALQALGCPGIVYGDFRATRPDRPKAGGLPAVEELRSGDLFILDYSVACNGYRCDFTNTITVGSPSEQQVAQFAACEKALSCGGDALGPGVRCRDVALAVDQSLRDSGLGELKHHAGHGIGLGHPEPPILTLSSDETLEEGDVVTIEPGLYIEGTGGIRLEHNYLIEASGARQLTQHRIALTSH